MAVATALRLELLGDCEDVMCHAFAGPLLRQLSRGYETCAVLPLPDAIDDWEVQNRTARKRANRADRLGYRFERVVRDQVVNDVHAINLSLSERQGRPMSDGYRERPSASPDPLYLCPRHGVHPYGIFKDGTLYAYAWIYRSGDLALVSQILGHGDHLKNDVMWLLIRGVVETEDEGFLVYNRADSGTPGLRWWKEHAGFEPMEVEWSL